MTMKKTLVLLLSGIALAMSASAQKDTTRVIDNKGTIKWVISSTAAVITKADSTLLYVTPKQLADSSFVKFASNGLTKNGQTVELGGALNRVTTIQTTASNFLQITGLQRGSNSADSVMVVDPSTGQLKFISASSLFNALAFENGLTKTGNTVQLGGSLVKPTTLTTDATNTLKIAGLQSGSLSSDSLVVSATDGTAYEPQPLMTQSDISRQPPVNPPSRSRTCLRHPPRSGSTAMEPNSPLPLISRRPPDRSR
ncbi:MAG: hypothetical protein EBZ67_02760 [Chitinophagia bacterium]|nr:hypothetical protein [Chitinophagia bacterium]